MKNLFTIMILACSCLLAACSDNGEEEPIISVSAISVSPATLSLEPGATSQLTATITPENASNATVNWNTSDMAVATVSSQGLVRAVAEGSAVITATAGGRSATCMVTVSSVEIPVESVEISPATLTLTAVGEIFQLTATVLPTDATSPDVSWSTSNADVATVSDEGLVTAAGAGNAVIIATAGEVSATCEVTVTISLVEIEGDEATINLSGGNAEDIARAIADAAAAGVTTFTLQGDYASLSLDRGNPFKGLTVTKLDLSGVTGWPVVSGNLQGIPDKAFYQYKDIKEVILPEEVKIIGESCFRQCTALTRIEAPGVQTLPNYVFQSCSALTEVVMPQVQSIGASVFLNATSLQRADFPQLKEVRGMAFYNCTSLTEANLPELVTVGQATDGLSSSSSAASAFSNCSALTSISLPKATVIGDDAFSGCRTLTEVNLPEATDIGKSAFRYCNSLTELTLPKATMLGDYALGDCPALVKLTLTAEGSISVTSHSFGPVDNQTKNIDLTLNSNKREELEYDSFWDRYEWKGHAWKSISFEE